MNPYTSDIQPLNNSDLKTHVVQILKTTKPKSITFYAVSSLIEVIDRYGLTKLDQESVHLWIATMLMQGMTINTVKRYAGRVHAIFKEWSKESGSDPFVEISTLLEPQYQLSANDSRYNYDLLKRLVGSHIEPEVSLWVKIFLYLLYNADITLADVAEATYDNERGYCAQVEEIVKTCDRSNGRKYLFSLKQGQVRPTQIQKELTAGISSTLKPVGMRLTIGSVRDVITGIWVVAALKCGVDICDIRAIIPSVPNGFNALTLVPKGQITEEHKRKILCQVADRINDNTPRWFAMKLRKGVAVEDLKTKIESELPGRLQRMELYYPTRTTTKRIGKKMHKQRTPYLPDLLFFRTQYNMVRSLFAHIGDLAWCYKTSSSDPESRYSTISNTDMANFQRCVGQFTDDIKLGLSSADQTLNKGHMVKITGGLMKGYQGIIEDLNDDKGTRMFSLRISNDNTLFWTAEVESAFIEPLPN